jgi:hypothetical protein
MNVSVSIEPRFHEMRLLAGPLPFVFTRSFGFIWLPLPNQTSSDIKMVSNCSHCSVFPDIFQGN